jgi:alpha-tubulin suppressor-like RCC1 family protein/uncharacterized protein YjdB
MSRIVKRSVAFCLALATVAGFLPVIPQQAALAFGEENSILMLVAGDEHTVALLDDGSVWAWGNNRNGQIGDGTTFTREMPVTVIYPGGNNPIVAIAAGSSHTLAVRANGELLAWGNNRNGQLGDSTTANRNRPRNVVDTNGNNFLAAIWGPGDEPNVVAGHGHTIAIGLDGKLYGWGLNNHGQLGLGHNRNIINPTQIQSLYEPLPPCECENARNCDCDPADFTMGRTRYKAEEYGTADLVAAGYNFTLAVLDDILYSFGNNSSGQLGQDDTINRNRPMRVWGVMPPGSNDDNDRVEISPTALRAGAGHAMAIEGDTLFGWGSNDFGQIDLGRNTNRFETPILMRDGIVDAQGGYHHTIIHQSDDTVLIHGFNSRGQLGNGFAEMVRSSNLVMIDDPDFEFESLFELDEYGRPMFDDIDMEDDDLIPRIPEIELEVSHIVAGYYYSAAIDSLGELWFWGENGYGQLGDATFTRRLRPFHLPKKVFYEDIVPVRTVTSDVRTINVGLGPSFGQKVTVTVNPHNALYSHIRWEIQNPDIASMLPMGQEEDENGNITHSVWIFGDRKVGSTILRATSYNGKNVSITVNVRPDPEFVEVTSRPTRLVPVGGYDPPGSSFLLRAAIHPATSYDRTISWSLHYDPDPHYEDEGDEENSIARIDQTGRLFALDIGTVYVRAQSVQKPEVYTIIPVQCGFFAEGTQIYEWPFDGDPKVPLRTVTLYIDRDEDGAIMPDTLDIHAVNLPFDIAGSDVTWRSSSPSVCDVIPDPNEPGKATLVARKTGMVTITATATDRSGSSARITVHIVPLGHSIDITAPPYSYNELGDKTVSTREGARLNFRPRVFPSQAEQRLHWTIENEVPLGANTSAPVGQIDSSRGIFTALAEGTCEVVGRTIDREGRCEEFCVGGVHTCRTVEIRITVNVIRPITRLVMTPRTASVTLGLYEYDDDDPLFTCLILPSNATAVHFDDGAIRWSSSNTNVAYFPDEFDFSSMVVRGSGTTRITATANDGTNKRAVATLRVMDQPTRVNLDRTRINELAVGRSVRLRATVLPRSASQDVVWFSEGPVWVDERGRVTALAATEEDEPARVWAVPRVVDPDDWNEDDSEVCEITCVVKVSAFRVQPSSVIVFPNSEARFRVDILPFIATNPGITMQSNFREIEAEMDGDFLDVDEDGFITLIIGDMRAGQYTVTLMCDGRRATVRLIVQNEPENINIDTLIDFFDRRDNLIMRGQTIAAGSMVRVEPPGADQTVIWHSSNELVARVDAKGNIRGVGPGEVEIYAVTRAVDDEGRPLVVSDVIELVCEVPVSSVRLNPTRAITLIEDGEAYELGVEILPAGAFMAEEWEYTITGRDSIISVEKNEDSLIIRPEEPGNVTLNVIHPNSGRRASIRVTVMGNPTAVEIRGSATERTIRRGTRFSLSARVEPSSANQRVFWESDDTSVVRISNSGAITVVGPGTATVWAWTYNAAGEEIESAPFTIHTIIPVTGIGMTPNTRSVTLQAGDSRDIDLETRPFPEAHRGVNTDWTVRTSRSTVAEATISESGDIATLVIHGVSPGTANITVRVGGKSVIINVRVTEPR